MKQTRFNILQAPGLQFWNPCFSLRRINTSERFLLLIAGFKPSLTFRGVGTAGAGMFGGVGHGFSMAELIILVVNLPCFNL
jgi:hypothetical protein